ncbi:MAG: AAA family ATPase, partial [Actinomycetota bacterium]|nr:AAA family ATPase [Actinomycetota bacterium]
AAQVATLTTRPSKPDTLDPDIARQHWQNQARTAGYDPDSLGLLAGPGRQPAVVDTDRLVSELVGPGGLTLRQSTFDRRHVIQAVAGSATDGIIPTALKFAAESVLAHRGVQATGRDTRVGGPAWTTVELAATETGLLNLAARRQHSGAAVCASEVIAEAVGARPSLGADQADMVTRICGSGHGIEVVVGRPGTGKTYALDTARAAWADSGIPVVGVAVAARTALALQAGTGIRSGTVDQFLTDLARPDGHPLPPGGVLIVDEAGMVGTRTLAKLAAAAESAQAKLVLVGDLHQLPELEAGGAFAALSRTVEPVELTVNRRQTHSWERAALEAIRTGQPTVAVAAYQHQRQLVFADTAEAARHALVTDWANSLASEEGDNQGRGVMVALTRADTDHLNFLAQTLLRHTGEIAPTGIDIAESSFGIGDRVMTLRNDRRLGVLNGTTGTITDIAKPGGGPSVTFRPDGTDTAIALPADYLTAGHLTHGWAITIHKAQGLTTNRAFVLGTDTLYREAGYVALSRATDTTRWYQVASGDLSMTGQAITPEHQAVLALTRSGAQHLATTPMSPAEPDRSPTPPSGRPSPDRPRNRQVGYLVAALGPQPEPGPERLAWQGGAVAIESYRHRHHIHSPEPLGPEPVEPADRADHAHTQRAVEAARQQIHDLAHHLDLGLGR